MRRTVVLILFAAFASVCAADDPPECKRFVERTGVVCISHTRERSGIDNGIRAAAASVTPRNIIGNVNCMTFGMDNSLFGKRGGRLFPGLWPEGRKPASFSARYATEGEVKVPDVVAAQPVRKAIIESRRPPEAEEHHEKHEEKHDDKHDEKHDDKHDSHKKPDTEHKPAAEPKHGQQPGHKE